MQVAGHEWCVYVLHHACGVLLGCLDAQPKHMSAELQKQLMSQ
jgi:hypothetical protein